MLYFLMRESEWRREDGVPRILYFLSSSFCSSATAALSFSRVKLFCRSPGTCWSMSNSPSLTSPMAGTTGSTEPPAVLRELGSGNAGLTPVDAEGEPFVDPMSLCCLSVRSGGGAVVARRPRMSPLTISLVGFFTPADCLPPLPAASPLRSCVSLFVSFSLAPPALLFLAPPLTPVVARLPLAFPPPPVCLFLSAVLAPVPLFFPLSLAGVCFSFASSALSSTFPFSSLSSSLAVSLS
mmetsp:Transcript_16845/g.65835  ORF Transcript_16845/g.65835 Transcript_16845/m.65835 type:complete len:238 (-) Transcript_16845:414-1127(-)